MSNSWFIRRRVQLSGQAAGDYALSVNWEQDQIFPLTNGLATPIYTSTNGGERLLYSVTNNSPVVSVRLRVYGDPLNPVAADGKIAAGLTVGAAQTGSFSPLVQSGLTAKGDLVFSGEVIRLVLEFTIAAPADLVDVSILANMANNQN